ncbi:MAG: hypothetical protein V7765_20230 [Oleispira sp.]
MIRTTCLLITTAMLSACFGSSGTNKSSTTSPAIPNYSYYFALNAELEVYSYEHGSAEKTLVASAPTAMEFSTQTDDNGVINFGPLFMFKNGAWQFVTPKDNTVKIIAVASNISKVCNSESVIGEEVTYLYYTTPGADAECAQEADNLSYRIDTSMTADSSALLLPRGLLFADEFQNVIIDDAAKGFLIKTESDDGTLLFSNLDLTSTVTVESNVTGYVRVSEFAAHDSIIIKFNDKLYDVTLAQLESGNIGEAFHTGSSLNTYTTRNQFIFSDGNKFYKYDLAKKESVLIYESSTSAYSSDVAVGNHSLLIQLDTLTDEFVHVSIRDLDAIKVTNLTIASATRSSRSASISGGFTLSTSNVDESQFAYFISDDGIVETINDAQWMNVTSSTLDVDGLPILLTFGETSNTLSNWSVETKSNEWVYGVLAKEIYGMRSDVNTASDTVLFTTLSGEADKKGLLYTFDVSKADSLTLIDQTSGFTVAF